MFKHDGRSCNASASRLVVTTTTRNLGPRKLHDGAERRLEMHDV